jgi:hypothetical protein
MNDLLIYGLYLLVLFVGALAYRFGKPWLDAKIGVEHSNLIFGWAQTFVGAAEQMMTTSPGLDKYHYVSSALDALADSKNINLSDDAMEAAIEAAVLELKKHKTPAVAAVSNVVVATAPQPAAEG